MDPCQSVQACPSVCRRNLAVYRGCPHADLMLGPMRVQEVARKPGTIWVIFIKSIRFPVSPDNTIDSCVVVGPGVFFRGNGLNICPSACALFMNLVDVGDYDVEEYSIM